VRLRGSQWGWAAISGPGVPGIGALQRRAGHDERMEIVCGGCGGENLARDPDAPRTADIPMLCLDCGWRGKRTPKVSCPKCGSPDVDDVAVDGWAYDDLDEFRDDPETAAWGYVGKTVFRCRKCHHDWSAAGTYQQYPGSSEGKALVTFVDDDAGYQAWLAAWPRGFVLNCHRNPSPDYLMLHRAECQFILHLGRGMTTFTGGYIKACSTDRAVIRQWARDQTGAECSFCQHCL
jgi:hypothetical protein